MLNYEKQSRSKSVWIFAVAISPPKTGNRIFLTVTQKTQTGEIIRPAVYILYMQYSVLFESSVLEEYTSVIDQLVLFVIPAVKLSDFLANLLRRMLGSQLSHSLKVNLLSGRGHIQQEFLGKASILNVA